MTRNRPTIWTMAVTATLALATACNFRGPGATGGDGSVPDAPPDVAVDAAVDGPRTDWWDAAWRKRRPITIDTGKLMGPVAKFPLLVKLPAGTIDLSNNHDRELRFVATDNATILKYEIDTLDNAATTFIWVQLDLTNAAATSTLWLYYNNTSAPPAISSGPDVFSSLYVSVHHLGQAVMGTNLLDSTGKNHTASAPGGQFPGATGGLVGGARNFDMNKMNYLALPTGNEADYDFTNSLTVSAWVKRTSLYVAYQAIVCKGDNTWRLHRENDTTSAGFGTNTGGQGNTFNLAGTTSIDDNNWHHLAIVFGNGTKRIFTDGVQDAMVAGGPIDTDNTVVAIGRNSNSTTGGARYWDGDIDEVRISADEHNTAWIHAEHLTVTDPAFVSIGAEEPYAP